MVGPMTKSRYSTRNGARNTHADRSSCCRRWGAGEAWARVLLPAIVCVLTRLPPGGERRRRSQRRGGLRVRLQAGNHAAERLLRVRLTRADRGDGRTHDDLEVRAGSRVPRGRVVHGTRGRRGVVGLRLELLVLRAVRDGKPCRDVAPLRPREALVDDGPDERQGAVRAGGVVPTGRDDESVGVRL